MCWSGEASATLAAAGIATTIYVAYKKEAKALWVPLLYFSLMELLQAFTYTVIDECSLPSNQIATLLGYLHISFQPFFINALSLYFIPQDLAKRFAPVVYSICFFSTVFMLVQVYPFEWGGSCAIDRVLCGSELCSFSGNWHIAWQLPLNSIGNTFAAIFSSGFPTYVIAAVFIPLLYGSWRITIYHILIGPGLSYLLTDNMNEWPAIWCLLSIGILVVVIKTPLRGIMFVNSWWLWSIIFRDQSKKPSG